MIHAVFPRHRTVRRDLNELELNRLSRRHRGIEKPVGIIRIQHGANGRIKCGAPITKLNRAPAQKNVVTHIGWRRAIHGESHGNQFRREHLELNRIGRNTT